MRYSFYDSEEYKSKQREITRRNQEKGVYKHLHEKVNRICVRDGCDGKFTVQPKDPRKFCGRGCAAIVNNQRRKHSDETKRKIAAALTGKNNPRKDVILVPRVSTACMNPDCKKEFSFERYKKRQYCSRMCVIQTVGRRPTSPKASRGKSGIRPDISASINFHSRWEANIARLYNHLGIAWMYEPRTFDIGGHTYTPDFYLPWYNEFIEVKNFLSPFSKKRDESFRGHYPHIPLKVLLKDEYMALEKWYGHSIPNWEFRR